MGEVLDIDNVVIYAVNKQTLTYMVQLSTRRIA